MDASCACRPDRYCRELCIAELPPAALTAKGGSQGVGEVASLSPGDRGELAGVIHVDFEVFGKWVDLTGTRSLQPIVADATSARSG